MVAGGASDAPQRILFDCRSEGQRHTLQAASDGRLTLTIATGGGAQSLATATLRAWHDIRVGGVIGQQGGHQDHLRLHDGRRHFVLFEGENGELSDDPGTTYAGLVVFDERSEIEPAYTATCEPDPINRTLLANVHEARAAGNAPSLREEDAGGQFDGWF
jgi:hypothetical protein